MSGRMSESPAGPRPPQVTIGGGVAAAGSVLLVVTLFGSIAGLSTVGMHQTIAQTLADSGQPWGLDVPGALHLLRDLMLAAGGVAAAAAVLAVFTLFRHRGARIGLTIAAALLLVTVVSGLFGVLVAAATAMLWTRPARDWFAGRAPAPRTASAPAGRDAARRGEPLFSSADEGRETGTGAGEPPRDEQPPPAPGTYPGPPPTYGFGTPQAHQGQQGQEGEAGLPYPGGGGPAPSGYPEQPAYPPPGGWQPPSQPPPYARIGGPPGRRPTTVTVAAVLTWLFSGIATVGYLAVIALLLADRTQLVNRLTSDPQFRNLNITDTQMIAAVWVVSAMVILWAVAAMVLAFLAFRGHNWARIVLVVSAAITFVVCLAAFPFGLAHMIVAGAVVVLLFTGGANDWFAGRGRAVYPPYGQWPPQGPQGLPQGFPQGPPQGPAQPPPPEEQEPPRNVW